MKKLIALLLFFCWSFGFAHSTKLSVSDTIWYDCNYQLVPKKEASLYKLHAYKIQDRFIHVYFSRITHKNTLISYSKDENDTMLDGKRTFYFDTGVVKSVVYYKENLRDGLYVEYYDDSKVYVQGTFKKDQKEGEFVVKDKNGKVCSSEFWSNGTKVDKKLKAKNALSKALVNR